VLQTLSPSDYRSNELAFGHEQQGLNFGHYLDILRARAFQFLLPFGIISVLGLYFAAIQKPSYLSEGKILLESQVIAPDFVRPIVTATAIERIQLIQQRVLTKDNLQLIANKFGLFPGRTTVDSMRKSVFIKPAEIEGQPRLGPATVAFKVGFEHQNPEVAMRVANEFVTLIVDEDARSRTGRATEAVKILTGEAKDIETKLEAAQTLITEIARRPRDEVPDTPEQEKSQLTALAALKAELIQKASVYSDAHPAVTALKKRIAAMERTLTQSAQSPAKARSTQADDLEAAKRQREVLEKRLAEANGKLATARLSQRLDRDQQTERFQVIESPSMPQTPEKSGRLKIVAIAFALALVVGLGTVFVTEQYDGSIRNRDQLSGLIHSHLVVSIPYMTTGSDIIRARLRKMFIALVVVAILTAWAGLASAIFFRLPIEYIAIGKAVNWL
jgi:uncharacterized protein involved in exopolysaccharide biosynthesis